MERQILEKLVKWKDSRYRKPLLLEGAHRVGKTWVLKTFGERCYENTVYVSFAENEAYKAIFEPNKDVVRILASSAKATGRTIEPGRTLIVLDDIGECPKALNALKYFFEVAPQYHVACAATLPTMGFSRPASFPVGKVNLMRLDPMSFTEVLRAEGDANPHSHSHGHPNSDLHPADPLDGLRTLHTLQTLEPIPEALFDELFEKLACYLTTGGMPEAVFKAVFKTVLLRTEGAKENTTKHASESAPESASELEHDADPVRSVLAESAKAYERDFVAHGKAREFSRIAEVWKSLPFQLARKHEAFEYGLVRDGARARTYEAAVRWLEEARLVHRIPRSTGLGLPVAAYDDRSAFRLYPADVGVLRGLARRSDLLRSSAAGAKGGANEAAVEADGNRPLVELNGALAEAFVLQSLAAQFEVTPRYWAEGSSLGATVFLIQRENEIFPVEVRTEGKELEDGKEHKEDGNGGGLDALSALDELKTLFPDRIRLCVRFSTENLKLKGDVLTVPLFLADRTDRLIGLALEQMKDGRSA